MAQLGRFADLDTRVRREPDLLCFSHLRWDFVFQRPQHLLTRCAGQRRVFYVEEPIYDGTIVRRVDLSIRGGVLVVTPHLPAGADEKSSVAPLRRLIDGLVTKHAINDYLLWYYTPMAMAFTDHLTPLTVVYDCMDELSAFKGASALLKQREAELMRRATLVLTGGQSLYDAKRAQHHNIHPFPSSVDVKHFAQARSSAADPPDQAAIGRPRLGYFGVIDERMDLALLRGVAEARPDWQIVMLGPVVKIDPVTLPGRANIYYLGAKRYEELPSYIAGWDVALLPFARNEATRFISPTKTPEYMAAGKPVVSTSIRDVVRPYGQQGLVRIADDVSDFVRACEAAMAENAVVRTKRADAFLRHMSWDGTWNRIQALVERALIRDEPSDSSAVAAAL